jgi:glycosyltransferase involved in cell wall biosynthesis
MVVLTSKWEGLSRVILEAMALEKAVIATRVGGNSEIIKHKANGLLITQESEPELCQAILELFDDNKLRIQLGEAGKKTVSKNFSLSRHADEIEMVYLEMNDMKKTG